MVYLDRCVITPCHIVSSGVCCQQRPSPRTVTDTVLAPRPGDEAEALSADGLELLVVSQALPHAWGVELNPATVVRIVPLVRTPWEVGHAVAGDRQFAGAGGGHSVVSLPARARRIRGPSHMARSRSCRS